jgi:hypothetical protein
MHGHLGGVRRRDRGLGRRLHLGGGRRGGRAGRQEHEWIDVPLVIAGPTQPEVHERLGEIDDAARPHRPDDGAFGDGRPALHPGRAQVDKRGRVAEGCLDRHCLASARDGPGKRDHPFGRRVHVCARGRAEVEAAMLAGGVRMRGVERKRTEHRAVDRPRPRLRRRRREHERAERENSESPKHERASLLPDLRTQRRYQDRVAVVNTGYKVRR